MKDSIVPWFFSYTFSVQQFNLGSFSWGVDVVAFVAVIVFVVGITLILVCKTIHDNNHLLEMLSHLLYKIKCFFVVEIIKQIKWIEQVESVRLVKQVKLVKSVKHVKKPVNGKTSRWVKPVKLVQPVKPATSAKQENL